MNFKYKNEVFGVSLVILIYWYFNIRNQDPISINMPIENMKNISIFDGNDLNLENDLNQENDELKSNSE